MFTRLENLPNEILLEIWSYLSLSDLCFSFLNLNRRLTSIVHSLDHVSHTAHRNDELLQLFGERISHLVIAPSYEPIDLTRCPRLRSLAIHNPMETQFEHIQPTILPQLRLLKVSSQCSSPSSRKLVEAIFSNAYPLLRHIDVGNCARSIHLPHSTTCNLQSVQLNIADFEMIASILRFCPALQYLEVRLDRTVRITPVITPVISASLRTFILHDCQSRFRLDTVENLLSCMPNVRWLYLQVTCMPSIADLARILRERVRHLVRFDCFMFEPVRSRKDEKDGDAIRRLHRCFNRIRVMIKDDVYRVYTTIEESLR